MGATETETETETKRRSPSRVARSVRAGESLPGRGLDPGAAVVAAVRRAGSAAGENGRVRRRCVDGAGRGARQ